MTDNQGRRPIGTVILDTRTGETGTVAEWVDAFEEVWRAPRDRLDRLLALLSDDVTLRAPAVPPVTQGKAACRRAFERAFRAMPDLSATDFRCQRTQWPGAAQPGCRSTCAKSRGWREVPGHGRNLGGIEHGPD